MAQDGFSTADALSALEGFSEAFRARYRILGLLGAGGMGIVVRAHQVPLKRDVAIKVMREFAPEALTRFLRESAILARLSHAGIVRVFECGEEAGIPYIVCELVDGSPLSAPPWPGPAPVDRVLDIGVQCAQALHYLHGQGCVHRDIKPGNILLDLSGRARLVDFGLARLLEAGNTVTATGFVVGTPYYMSPEQLTGNRPSPESDQYSLAAVLCELLAGSSPGQRLGSQKQLGALYGKLPPALCTVLARALNADPARRYGDAGLFAAALAAVASVSARGPRADPVAAGAGRKRVPASIRRSTGIATGVLALVGLALVIQRSAPQVPPVPPPAGAQTTAKGPVPLAARIVKTFGDAHPDSFADPGVPRDVHQLAVDLDSLSPTGLDAFPAQLVPHLVHDFYETTGRARMEIRWLLRTYGTVFENLNWRRLPEKKKLDVVERWIPDLLLVGDVLVRIGGNPSSTGTYLDSAADFIRHNHLNWTLPARLQQLQRKISTWVKDYPFHPVSIYMDAFVRDLMRNRSRPGQPELDRFERALLPAPVHAASPATIRVVEHYYRMTLAAQDTPAKILALDARFWRMGSLVDWPSESDWRVAVSRQLAKVSGGTGAVVEPKSVHSGAKPPFASRLVGPEGMAAIRRHPKRIALEFSRCRDELVLRLGKDFARLSPTGLALVFASLVVAESDTQKSRSVERFRELLRGVCPTTPESDMYVLGLLGENQLTEYVIVSAKTAGMPLILVPAAGVVAAGTPLAMLSGTGVTVGPAIVHGRGTGAEAIAAALRDGLLHYRQARLLAQGDTAPASSGVSAVRQAVAGPHDTVVILTMDGKISQITLQGLKRIETATRFRRIAGGPWDNGVLALSQPVPAARTTGGTLHRWDGTHLRSTADRVDDICPDPAGRGIWVLTSAAKLLRMTHAGQSTIASDIRSIAPAEHGRVVYILKPDGRLLKTGRSHHFERVAEDIAGLERGRGVREDRTVFAVTRGGEVHLMDAGLPGPPVLLTTGVRKVVAASSGFAVYLLRVDGDVDYVNITNCYSVREMSEREIVHLSTGLKAADLRLSHDEAQLELVRPDGLVVRVPTGFR